MKRLFRFWLVGLVAYEGMAQYQVDLFTFTTGGGTITGGVYTAKVTIGEPVTGTVTGGPYRSDVGFWSIVNTTQTSGDPSLTVAITSANTVLVCWPSSTSGFVLEQNSNLGTSNWSPVPQQPSDDGTVKCISLGSASGEVFLRLKK